MGGTFDPTVQNSCKFETPAKQMRDQKPTEVDLSWEAAGSTVSKQGELLKRSIFDIGPELQGCLQKFNARLIVFPYNRSSSVRPHTGRPNKQQAGGEETGLEGQISNRQEERRQVWKAK